MVGALCYDGQNQRFAPNLIFQRYSSENNIIKYRQAM